MPYTEEKKEQIINNFLNWCEKVGYSGEKGVNVVIIDGLPLAVNRPLQSLRFDQNLTLGKQNSTME